LGSGFDRIPGGWYYENVSAYAYHTYCWPMDVLPGNATDDERHEAVAKCTDTLLPRFFQVQEDDVKVTNNIRIVLMLGILHILIMYRFTNKHGQSSFVRTQIHSFIHSFIHTVE
jgi:hypothetical protein